jgi:hypothetical protein
VTTLERLVDILEKEYDHDHWAINLATIEPEVRACPQPELLGR